MVVKWRPMRHTAHARIHSAVSAVNRS